MILCLQVKSKTYKKDQETNLRLVEALHSDV